jgi:geranylgeranyl diphosphate synthase, type I
MSAEAVVERFGTDFIPDVRACVDARLVRYFEAKREEVRAKSPASVPMVDAIADLTMRGGKRLRPVVVAAVVHAVRGEDLPDAVASVGSAFELLQSYLLIHDDFMDEDEERRGGPAVHMIFRRALGEKHLGDSVGILAGDLASAYAWELLFEAPFPRHREKEGFAAFLELTKEVYLGQHLDMVATDDVERIHDLKTGSYTSRGPVAVAAALADASPEQARALAAWARPLGEAFQLRDDLLGTFGEASVTGKPGDDIPHGKRTAVVAAAEKMLDAPSLERLRAVLGQRGAPRDALSDVLTMLDRAGVKQAVEARVDTLYAASEAALETATFTPVGRARLTEVASKLVRRAH